MENKTRDEAEKAVIKYVAVSPNDIDLIAGWYQDAEGNNFQLIRHTPQPVENKSAVWVKVETMPAINVIPGVLVYSLRGGIDVQPVFNNGNGQPTFRDGWRKGEGFEVTHWMPLPKKPDENSGASQIPETDPQLIEVKKIIDMYQIAREETKSTFMWYEMPDILRAVQNLLERKVAEKVVIS